MQLVELKSGETYNGQLQSVDIYMNIQLSDVICTSKEGDRFWRLPEAFIRGPSIKYLRISEEVLERVPSEEAALDQAGRGCVFRNTVYSISLHHFLISLLFYASFCACASLLLCPPRSAGEAVVAADRAAMGEMGPAATAAAAAVAAAEAGPVDMAVVAAAAAALAAMVAVAVAVVAVAMAAEEAGGMQVAAVVAAMAAAVAVTAVAMGAAAAAVAAADTLLQLLVAEPVGSRVCRTTNFWKSIVVC